MKRKEKNKITESLMAFYQIVCGLFDGLAAIQDELMKGIILKEHLFQLLVYHKQFTDANKIGLPEVGNIHKSYCDDYTKKVMSLAPLFDDLIKKYSKKEGIGYIT